MGPPAGSAYPQTGSICGNCNVWGLFPGILQERNAIPVLYKQIPSHYTCLCRQIESYIVSRVAANILQGIKLSKEGPTWFYHPGGKLQ